MDFANERYVRLYTRDTVTWRRWSWQARAVFGLLLRKVDRSGVLDTGRDDKADALALIIDVPLDVTATVLAEWVNSGTVELKETAIFLPRLREAQEAAQSDKMRQTQSRERRALATSQLPEDARHTVSHGVTSGHTASQVVTPAVPSRAVPSQPAVPVAVTSAGKKPKKPKAQAELPQIIPPAPPREPSRGEVLFQKFQDTREDHLKDVLEVEAYADASYSPVHVNKVFRGWFDLWIAVPFNEKWREVGLINGAEVRCIQLFDAYLALDWPAKCLERIDGKDTDKPQPYPFSSLSSEKVWGEAVAKLWPDEPYAQAWPERREQLYADKPRRGAA